MTLKVKIFSELCYSNAHYIDEYINRWLEQENLEYSNIKAIKHYCSDKTQYAAIYYEK